MVSKHSAVRSIRLQNELWAWLSEEAARRETNVNGLVSDLLAAGRREASDVPRLTKEEIAHVAAVIKPGVKVRVVDDGAVPYVPLRMPRAPAGSRLKPGKGAKK